MFWLWLRVAGSHEVIMSVGRKLRASLRRLCRVHALRSKSFWKFESWRQPIPIQLIPDWGVCQVRLRRMHWSSRIS